MCIRVNLRLSRKADLDIIMCKDAGINIQNVITAGIKNSLTGEAPGISTADAISVIKDEGLQADKGPIIPKQIGYTTSDKEIINLLKRYSALSECSLSAVLKSYFRSVIQLPPEIIYGIDVEEKNTENKKALEGENLYREGEIQNIPSIIYSETKKAEENREKSSVSEEKEQEDSWWDDEDDYLEEDFGSDTGTITEEEMLSILDSL